MRFSLLSLFGVMTALALLLGLPVVLYAMGGWILVSASAVVVLIAMYHSVRELGIDLFISLLSRRRRLEDWNLPANADYVHQRSRQAAEVRDDLRDPETGEPATNAPDASGSE